MPCTCGYPALGTQPAGQHPCSHPTPAVPCPTCRHLPRRGRGAEVCGNVQLQYRQVQYVRKGRGTRRVQDDKGCAAAYTCPVPALRACARPRTPSTCPATSPLARPVSSGIPSPASWAAWPPSWRRWHCTAGAASTLPSGSSSSPSPRCALCDAVPLGIATCCALLGTRPTAGARIPQRTDAPACRPGRHPTQAGPCLPGRDRLHSDQEQPDGHGLVVRRAPGLGWGRVGGGRATPLPPRRACGYREACPPLPGASRCLTLLPAGCI